MTLTLTDLQLVLLTAAAQRSDGSLLPPPENITAQATRIRKGVQSLIKRGLVAETAADLPRAWRQDGDAVIGVFITAAGREAIGAPEQPEPVAADEGGAAKRPTKAAAVLALLRREQGVTLDELVAATGWLPHTTRAALTGLRKKGHAVERGKRDNATCYSVAQAA